MINYLTDLLSPPVGDSIMIINDLGIVAWDTISDNSITGMIIKGEPDPAQAKEIYRVLIPGAYVATIPLDSEPLGYKGACNLEDVGFEIRDAILCLRNNDAFYYVPKPSRTEREAGCQGKGLKPKTGAQAVNRKEGSAGMNNPRAGSGRTAKTVYNFHPTVKPINMMKFLLRDVPKDSVVMDPFMGSGSTGIACVQKGRSFIGVDSELDYVKIADARIRHWAKLEGEWDINSDSNVKIPDKALDW